MKHKGIFLIILVLLFFFTFRAELAFADGETDDEDVVERESVEYEPSQFSLMTHADDKWYELHKKTGTAIVTAIKTFLWEVNKAIGYLTMMIVFHLFSLDIIEMTKPALEAIASGTAASMLSNFTAFAMAVASIGIVIRTYVKQDWNGFFKIISLILLSLILLFSIRSEKFNYIDYAHQISLSFENAIMKVNPTLSDEPDSIDFDDFDQGDADTVITLATLVENKVYNAVIYKPYLLLQYGTTKEERINEEGIDAGVSYDSGETRITQFLNANAMTKEGMETREKIMDDELEKIKNPHIFAGNGFESSAYIISSIVSTTIQLIIFFFLSLMRILMQYAMIVILILLPIVLILSLFPTFEALFGKYLSVLAKVILFKGILVFFILLSTSFISLSYDITEVSPNMFYRIFVQITFAIGVIFMYLKRGLMLDMLDGAGAKLSNMGIQDRFNQMRGGANRNVNPQGINGGNEGAGSNVNNNNIGEKGNMKARTTNSNGNDKNKDSKRSIGEKISDKASSVKSYISKVQKGEIPNYKDPYVNEENGNLESSPYHNSESNEEAQISQSGEYKNSPYHTNVDRPNVHQVDKKQRHSARKPVAETQRADDNKKESQKIKDNIHSSNKTNNSPSNLRNKKPKVNNRPSSLNNVSNLSDKSSKETTKRNVHSYRGVNPSDYKGVRDQNNSSNGENRKEYRSIRRE